MLCLYPHKDGTSCGQCMNCLLNKHYAWRFRLEQELLHCDLSFWLTLTYDDQFLHIDEKTNIPVLSKVDFQNFLRKLRKATYKVYSDISYKYFLSAEYGGQTDRPHGHMLLLVNAPNYQFYELLKLRNFISNQIRERWYHGFVKEKPLHDGVISYLSKYVFKTSEKDYLVKPFRLISKNLGYIFLEQLDIDSVIANNFRSPYGVLPRYYRDKIVSPVDRKLINLTNLEEKRLSIRSRFSENLTDFLYSIELAKLKSAGSLEKYYERQNFLRQCSRRMYEQKQKYKYG